MSDLRKIEDGEEKPWFLFWLPYLALLALLAVDEGPSPGGAVRARMGSALSFSGKPAEVFGKLLDEGPDPRAAVAVRRMLRGGLPPDVARAVAIERFQHWTTRSPASYQLGTAGIPAIPLLTELLVHDSERVRQEAAHALGDIGLGAAPAIPALETLSRRTPLDASTHAARSALGDVAPSGVTGWLWKLWYDVPLVPFVVLALTLVELLFLYPRFFARRASRGDPLPSPSLWTTALAGAVAALALPFALLDLRGERFTSEADVWFLALGVWCGGAVVLSLLLRRRLRLRAASGKTAPAS